MTEEHVQFDFYHQPLTMAILTSTYLHLLSYLPFSHSAYWNIQGGVGKLQRDFAYADYFLSANRIIVK